MRGHAPRRRRLLGAALAAGVVACSSKFNWRDIKSPDGGFVVALPDKPQTVTRSLVVSGHPVEMTMVSTGVGPTVFAVGYVRLPAELRAGDSVRAATLAYFRAGLVRNIEGEVLAQAPVAIGRPGGTVTGEQLSARGRIGPDGRAAQLVARLVLVDDRFYQVVALGAEGELPAEVLETFFTSFRIAH